MQSFSIRTVLVAVSAIALVILTSCTSVDTPKGDRVTVSRISSGQLIEVLDPSSATPLASKVRLLGVDAPAWKQEPWFTQSLNALDALLNGNQPIVLEFDVQPQIVTKAGNTLRLAYLWKDGKLVNEELLKQGWGVATSFAPNTKHERRLAQAQERARLLGLGIWDPKNPMRETPHEFRKAQEADS